jgi:hypothetical protein
MFENMFRAWGEAKRRRMIETGPKLIVAVHTSISVFQLEAVRKDCGLVCNNPYRGYPEILILNDDGTIVGPEWCKKWYPISGFKKEVE